MAVALGFDKTKTPPPVWQWGLIKLKNESEPDRRAAKQRGKQQSKGQIAIHWGKDNGRGWGRQIFLSGEFFTTDGH